MSGLTDFILRIKGLRNATSLTSMLSCSTVFDFILRIKGLRNATLPTFLFRISC